MTDDINGYKNTMDQCTGIGIADRQKSIKWLGKQNDLVVYEVFKLQKKHFHRFKSGYPNENPILIAQVSFFQALSEYISDLKLPNRKNRSTNFGYLKKVSKSRVIQFKKARASPKYEKMLNIQQVIIDLIEVEKFKPRAVAAYVTRHHFEISHVSINKFYKKIQEHKNDHSNS